MKRFRYLIWLCVFCLLISGCQTSLSDASTDPTPETTVPARETTTPTDPVLTMKLVRFSNPDILRLPYNANAGGVQYVTSADKLPAYDALEKYDDAYFESKGLLLISVNTATSTVKLSITSISVADNQAAVLLNYAVSGDAVTSDMTTWLLWAEVDAGLDALQWSIVGTTGSSPLETHKY